MLSPRFSSSSSKTISALMLSELAALAVVPRKGLERPFDFVSGAETFFLRYYRIEESGEEKAPFAAY